MRKRNWSFRRRGLLERSLRRREALKGLGALAVSLPVLGSVSCASKDTPKTDGDPNLTGSGGSVATGTGGTGAGGATSTSTATQGAGGSGGASNVVSGSGGMAAAPGTGGAAANPMAGTGGATSTADAGGHDASTGDDKDAGGGDFVPVTFEDAASCTLTPTDLAGEGPFFIHEDEVMDDVDLIRSDMSEGKEGIELQLNLRVLDSEKNCMTPISGVEVYVWHTDATGFYSGFNNQNPDMTYSGAFERTVENSDRFCRGIQITDDDGVVKFRTLYPGWYNGRPIHIHFVALRPGSGADTSSYRSTQYMVFTTQMYFEEQFSRMIHEHNAPYNTRASGPGYEMYVKPGSNVRPTMTMQGNVAVGVLNIITAAFRQPPLRLSRP